MPGRIPKPAEERRNRVPPSRGEWQPSGPTGWQHGDVPPCPAKSRAALETWGVWFSSWYAAHWGPEDLPVLRLVIKLWARCDAGKATGAERSELRQLMDSCGITKKGQQDRRWSPPKPEAAPVSQPEGAPATKPSRYDHLRTVAS
ncbi:MAG: hypothetical protein U0838_13090 [Chloroflexota bacterium]